MIAGWSERFPSGPFRTLIRNTAEPGKALVGDWLVRKRGYRLQIRGPNHWFRNLLGGAAETRLVVPPRGATWTVPIGTTGGWYDIELESSGGSSFFRRLSGRVESGRPSISRPAGSVPPA